MKSIDSLLNQLPESVKPALDRSVLIDLLRTQQPSAGSSVHENIDRLANPETVVLITGQQLGLLGGPIYTLTKLLDCVLLAREIEHRHGIPVVPVFWLEGEDADVEEVGHVNLFLNDRIIQYRYPDHAGPSVGGRTFNARIHELAFTIGESTPFEAEVNWAEAFYQYLKPVLDDTGAVAFHSNRDDVHAALTPVWNRILENYEGLRSAIINRTQSMEESGDPVQVTVNTDESFLFQHTKTERRKLNLEEVRSAEISQLSPNVLLRPLVQDLIFPSVGYVGGQAELRYQQQLSDAYSQINRDAPILIPRTHHIILNPKTRRLLAQYQFPETLTLESFNERVSEIQHSDAHQALEQQIETYQADVNALMASLNELEFTDKRTQGRILDGAKNRMNHVSERLQRRISRLLTLKDEVTYRHMNYLRAILFPHGQLQERFYPVWQFEPNLQVFARQYMEQTDIFSRELQLTRIR